MRIATVAAAASTFNCIRAVLAIRLSALAVGEANGRAALRIASSGAGVAVGDAALVVVLVANPARAELRPAGVGALAAVGAVLRANRNGIAVRELARANAERNSGLTPRFGRIRAVGSFRRHRATRHAGAGGDFALLAAVGLAGFFA